MTPLPAPAVMAILNLTPDSFYDGGRYPSVERASERALQMLGEGADMIDCGGESTGPGSKTISTEEELRRVIPVLEEIRSTKRSSEFGISDFGFVSDFDFRISDFPVSVDTYKSPVAVAALKVGATMINDVTAGRGDPAMMPLIAESGCKYVMMRSKDPTPRTTVAAVQYEDVMQTIHTFFEERITSALHAGIRQEQLILDPGLGHFVSSDPRYSWEILERLEELQDFGCPILVSPSRKSFTAVARASCPWSPAQHNGQDGRSPLPPPSERLPGTLLATRIALAHGARIIRTHDIAETKKILSGFRSAVGM